MDKQKLTEKIYAGLIGMDAGMRLGAPVENPFWTYERLRDHYGDIRGYLRVHKNHTADDDVNGPILLVRALTDKLAENVSAAPGQKAGGNCAAPRDQGTGRTNEAAPDRELSAGYELTPEDCGEAWLNYTRFGKGMFWWGGEDLSTEHRAYMNLRRGVQAPESGSSRMNGKTASEQIGGQIFSDTWGLICPGDPERAAAYARTAASVSHDGNGLHGAAFIAASVAAAFEASTVDEILDAGLRVLPEDCDYANVVRAVRNFHAAHPREEEFRACRDYIEKEWGHDKFPGGWHIIPNAGICITGLLYGGGDLGRSIEISVMCGFDTDCNASSIGTILGVFSGIERVPQRYRDPIRDTVILSGISGYLNMVDLPSLAYELAEAAYTLQGPVSNGNSGTESGIAEGTGEKTKKAAKEETTEESKTKGDLVFDFELPGSTHGLRLSEQAAHSLRNVEGEAWQGERCLELMIDGKRPGPADLYFTGCFIRSDLEDERYEPVFSPRVYPGQTVSCRMRAKHIAPAEMTVVPFVTLAMSGRRIDLEPVKLARGEKNRAKDQENNQGKEQGKPGEKEQVTAADVWAGAGMQEEVSGPWQKVRFTVPDAGGDQIHELGWRVFLKPDEDPWAMSFLYIDMVTVSGPMDYTIDFGLQREEFGQITPFSFNDCVGKLVPDCEDAETMLSEAAETIPVHETEAPVKMLSLTMPGEQTACGCQAFTGNYYQREVHASAEIEIREGGSALLLLRGQGTRRYYALGISEKNKAVILRYDGGKITELAAGEITKSTAEDLSERLTDVWDQGGFCPYEGGKEVPPGHGQPVLLEASAVGQQLTLSVNGREILTAEDGRFSYGMTGLGMTAPGEILVRELHITGNCR